MTKQWVKYIFDKALAPFDLILRRRSTLVSMLSEQELLPGEKYSPLWLRLEFPPSAICKPRWGWGNPNHDLTEKILEAKESQYIELLNKLMNYKEYFARIPVFQNEADPQSPTWVNGALAMLDTASLYFFIAECKPETYLEVGSGNSTRFARRAVKEHSPNTRIVSIDPQPRAEIDSICDEVIRSSLEEASMSLFLDLKENDIVFIDGSHKSFMNNDVTVFMVDILPRLKPGVIVHIHDICIPVDYPPDFGAYPRWYNEQYLLMAYILGGARNIDIIFPCYYIVTNNTRLQAVFKKWVDSLVPYWTPEERKSIQPWGASFWMKIKEPDS